ncbi:MAG TPA: homocysteine S-methyltransferase family protein [Enhygromyxa sp.]|nr:homocysteine S-methyltransferase family protein [Enhygromyxa sp.]
MREPIILLDGAMATQLAARGFALTEPLFAARALLDAPELVGAIHFDYLLAGAQVLTTNSFGLHASTLARAGIGEQQRALARRAVEILAHVRHGVLAHDRQLACFRIAGSIPPRPRDEWGGHPELARAEYRCLAEHLAEAGVDLILLETFTNLAEAELALAGLAGIDLPIWLSIVAGAPRPTRPDGTRLIDGEPLAELASLVDRVDALLINCTQIDAIPAALDALIAATDTRPELPLGVSPHFGKRRYDGVWIDRIIEADVFAGQMQAWLQSERPGRARFVLAGACCGSQPDDIAALRRRLQPDELERERAWTRLAELVP